MATPDPNVRISNAEREAVIGRLHAATEEGRLELDEFAERSRKVYEAKTFAEVEHLLNDLPETGGALAVPDAPARRPAVPDIELSPAHSAVKRQGAWKVPARIKVEPRHSRVVLDCRSAVFTSSDIAVEVDLVHSSCTIVLPPGATAVDENVQLNGGAVRNTGHGEGAGPTFHLSGRVHHSSLTVRYERRFLWWRW